MIHHHCGHLQTAPCRTYLGKTSSMECLAVQSHAGCGGNNMGNNPSSSPYLERQFSQASGKDAQTIQV